MDSKSKEKRNTSQQQKVKRELRKKPALSHADIIERVSKLKVESPQILNESLFLFEALRSIKDLSNAQIKKYFDLVEDKLQNLWIPLLTKTTVILCHSKYQNDLKLLDFIHDKSKEELSKYGVPEMRLIETEKEFCSIKSGKVITQFLSGSQKSNIESQKTNSKIKKISNQNLACLSFVGLSVYCRRNHPESVYIKLQLIIDRAIAEFFSAPEISEIKKRDLIGKTLGDILSAKIFSVKKISELTYLYSGTTEQIIAKENKINTLNEIYERQISKINELSEEIKAEKKRNLELQEYIEALKKNNEQLADERDATENMLEYEKTKFKKIIQTREAGIAEQISNDIGLELLAMRDLVEYLEEDDKQRFRRRLDRIDRYLQEFGGEQ